MKLTGAQILWECLRARGRHTRVRLSRAARSCRPTTRCWSIPIRHVLVRHEQGATHMADGYARASGQGRRGDRDLRPGRDQHGDRHRHRDDGLVADRLHHRPGRQQADRLRRVPGNRHHRRHAADHEAQLPGDARRRRRAGDPRGVPHRAVAAGRARCSSTSPRTRSRRRAEFDWDAAAPQLHGYRPDPPAADAEARAARSS